MSIPVKLGDPMPLFLQLGGSVTGKFIKASLKDAAGVSLGAFPLADRGLGLYSSPDVAMSGATVVYATYEVFDDAGFTVPSPLYQNGEDVFLLDTGSSATPAVDLQSLEVVFGATSIDVDVVTDSLEGELVESPAVVADVAPVLTVEAAIDNQTIEGEIDAC